MLHTTSPHWSCDLDGDGTLDGPQFSVLTSGLSLNIANKISNIVDGDGAIETGDKAWNAAGKVKMYGVTHTSYMIHCI